MKIYALVPSLTLLFAANVFAAGYGVAAPKVALQCVDASKNIYVDVVSYPSNYDQLNLAVQTITPAAVELDMNVERRAGTAPGDALAFVGARFRLDVSMTPRLVNETLVRKALLKDSQAVFSDVDLDCAFRGQ